MKKINGFAKGRVPTDKETERFTGEISHIFAPKPALNNNCATKHGTVILLKVLGGTIKPGDPITVSINGTVKKDFITRIEKGGQKVLFAGKGEGVGICLLKSATTHFIPGS